MVGVHPDPYTLRQLVWMAEQRHENSWNHTSWISAYVANAGMNTKRFIQPSEVNPYLQSRKKKRLRGKGGFQELKGMLF